MTVQLVATKADWSELTSRTAAKLGRLTFKMSRSEIDRQADELAGTWKDYNDNPTKGHPHIVGRGAHTPVPASSGITWDVYDPPGNTPKPPKTLPHPKTGKPVPTKSWLRSVGPKSSPDYDSDDPYRPGGPLAIRQAEYFADAQCGQPRYSTRRLGQDAAFGGGKGQPKDLVPGKCWEQFTRQPRNTRRRDEREENDDKADFAEPTPFFSGNRSLSEQANSMEPGTWNVSASWWSNGQFLPGIEWSQANERCYVCGAALPEPHGKRKYCPGECGRVGDNARRRGRTAARRRRRLTPDDNNRNPRTGGTSRHLQSPTTPQAENPNVHRWHTKPKPMRTLSRDYRLVWPWAGEPKVWEIRDQTVTKISASTVDLLHKNEGLPVRQPKMAIVSDRRLERYAPA
jgi:predicted nucleic acid-binding Zn ribbon protein